MCHDAGFGSWPHAGEIASKYQYGMMWSAIVTPASLSRDHTGSKYGSPGERPYAGPVGNQHDPDPGLEDLVGHRDRASRSRNERSAVA